MQRYKAIIAYNGTYYCGWQVQGAKPTIAKALADAFFRAFRKKIVLYGASRTDSGVHAFGQVATFDTDLILDIPTMIWAWNNALPASISLRSLEPVENNFRLFHAEKKCYFYHLFLERPLPFLEPYGWWYRKKIWLQALEEYLALFVGTHDFRSFSTGNDRKDDTIRAINSITLEYYKRYNVYRIVVVGPKFLHHMIRRIVGACIDGASREHFSQVYLQYALEKKNLEQNFMCAPAKGLLLYKILYNTGNNKKG